MNCSDSHNLLQQRLDGTPIESPELLEHLRGCPDCRALEKATRRLQDGLRLMVAPVPTADFAARVVKRVLLDRRRIRRRARQRWTVTLALAAGLFIALGLRLDWRGSLPGYDGGTSQPEVTQVQPTPKETPTPLAPAEPTLRESVTEAGEAVAALTSKTADETVGSTRWLVGKVPSPSLPKVDLNAIEPPTRPLREAGQGVSTGLEPVTNSARRAVDLFLRELPPMDMGPKGL